MTDTKTCKKQVQRVTVILVGVIATDDFYLLTDAIVVGV